MNCEFTCKGKKLADYLVGHGAALLRTERNNGTTLFVFENNGAIDELINKWESDKKKWLF